MTRQSRDNDLIETACRHMMGEFGLENMEPSFGMDPLALQRAHDAIHEFVFLAPLLSPPATEARAKWDWQTKSAFLLYHTEVFNHAHRSLCEALCAYYNVAFVLLRVTCELLIKGAFCECMSHKSYRENSSKLYNSKGKLKEWLEQVFERSPNVEAQLEQTSATIYDIIAPRMTCRDFLPSMRTMVRQLAEWDMFDPVPNAATLVYEEIYGRLSADVHVVPGRTDIGRRITTKDPDIFGQKVLPEVLSEYAASLHTLMDLAIVIELNVMKSLVDEHEESRDNLRKRLDTLTSLQLRYGTERAEQLVESAT